MAEPSYNIKDVYKEINTINGYFGVKDGGNVEFGYPQINTYCRYMDSLGNCRGYLEMASSGVIYVLKTLKEKYDLEYDKLAEYAILWLRYKLNQKAPHYDTQLDEFYTKHIKDNNYYNGKINGDGSPTYKDIIDTKKDLMNIKKMTKFSYPFYLLLSFYNEINQNKLDCKNCSKKANEFVQNFEILNDDSNTNGNTSYRKLLSTLSNDYDNFKSYFAEKCSHCSDLPTLPEIKTPPSKLIPVLSTFSVIPVFLGIAYKYSLFGIDKIFQRQYLRKKLKKVKKKLKRNI
ncbi:CIR protein PIR protein [Plasmodium vinckei petteri]|uniref:CIR protein PIR protein n=1 Tax=Plasmodium vinckei petteri TaxID=138298 RepID=A0A6V7T6W7_PLAVN|nr:CIR protein PIR protein [Plasmodium vinckei petteri]